MLVTLTYLSLISSKISYKQFLTLLLVWNCFRGHKLLFLVFICFYWILWVILYLKCCFPWLSGESVQFSHWVVSNTLWLHALEHTRLPCLSPIPEACSNSCPLRRWCHPAVSSSVIPFSCLQSFPASGSFSNKSVLHIRWPKYWSFIFSISPSNEYSGLISFRIDWLDLLAVQGTFKSLLQHHNSKASILQCSAFFIVQLSHPYMTIGKTIPLTRRSI